LLANGVLVEGYRIDRLIGEGGMGTVYEATQLSLDRKVALKLLSTELSVDSGFRERFRHEARIQGAMDHPNIVTVHEAGESDYGLFIAMELIRGATLKDLIVGRELDAGRTLRILTQVAEALDNAHEAGLIHRDIKPHNILVRAGGRDHAYLADFGVTKVRGGTNLTKTGQFVGTVDYMAPEQIRGEAATRETDIYALGTVLYECLSGVVPFPKDSDVAVMYAHLADPPPQVTQERPELPPELDAVISTAMAKDPSDRYSSAVKMMEAYEQALGDGGKAVATIPPPIETAEDIGLREDAEAPARAPDTAPSTTRADETKAAPVQRVSTPDVVPPAPEEPVPADAGVAGSTAGSATVAAGVPAAAPTTAGAAPTTAGAPPTTAGVPPPEAHAVAAPAPAPVAAARPVLPAGLVWGIAALVVLAAAAGGFLIGHSGGSKTKAASKGTVIRAGLARYTAPAGWHRVAKAPVVPYLPLTKAVGVAPAGNQKDGLVVGNLQLSWPFNLPSGFIGHEVAGTQTSYRTRGHIAAIGKLQVFRVSGVQFSGSKGLYTIYWLPQQGKHQVAAAACFSKSGSVGALERCEAIVSGITVPGAKPYPLVPSASYASKVSSALKTLGRKRTSGLAKLKSKSASAQSKAAKAVSKAYTAAGAQLRSAGAPAYARPANDRIASALTAAQRAYSSLASAAAAKSSSRYSAARSAAAAAEKQLSSAVAELKSLGYKVG
jgi:protein kinase-like protein